MNTKNTFKIHQIIESAESGAYDNIDWGEGEPEMDKEEFNQDLKAAFEGFMEVVEGIFSKIGVECTLLRGDETDFDYDEYAIGLGNNKLDYGYILVNKQGFEWRKTGFAPVMLPDAWNIEEFAKFLGNERYNWLSIIEEEKATHMIGFDKADYIETAYDWVNAGFLRDAYSENGIRYCLIGVHPK